MKTFARFMFAVMIALVSTGYAFEAENTFDLQEPEIKISIPDEYYVYTRHSDIDNSEITIFGITMQKLLWQMEWNDVYLDAEDKNRTHEISVIMTQLNPEYDFRTLNNQELDTICSGMGNYYDEENAILYTAAECYRADSGIFIKHYATMQREYSSYYMVSYYTVHKGKAITIRLVSFEGKISESEESLINRIVDSVSFYDETDNNRNCVVLGCHPYSILYTLFLGISVIFLVYYVICRKCIQRFSPKPLHNIYNASERGEK